LNKPKDLVTAVQNLTEENALLKKQVEKFEGSEIRSLANALSKNVKAINGVNFIGEIVESGSADALKKLAFELKQKVSNHCIVLAAAIGDKAAVVVQIDDNLVKEKGLDASLIIKQKVAGLIKGGGGGQKTLATAGGQDISALHQVIETVKSLL
jgi:alanyl-tRNA synthetase